MPLPEVGIFLVEKVEFLVKKLDEEPKNECCLGLACWVEVLSIQVGLDSAIRVVIVEVGNECVQIGEGTVETGNQLICSLLKTLFIWSMMYSMVKSIGMRMGGNASMN